MNEDGQNTQDRGKRDLAGVISFWVLPTLEGSEVKIRDLGMIYFVHSKVNATFKLHQMVYALPARFASDYITLRYCVHRNLLSLQVGQGAYLVDNHGDLARVDSR